VGFEDIINLCPLRALCQKAFPASSNFSPEVFFIILADGTPDSRGNTNPLTHRGFSSKI
jgi:hypothetical protein